MKPRYRFLARDARNSGYLFRLVNPFEVDFETRAEFAASLTVNIPIDKFWSKP